MRSVATCLSAFALAAAPLTVPAAAQAAPGDPPGAPGAPSHFDLARKDCVGTARNTTSKLWYTVADGVLSDVYSPTVDTTDVETLQYVVTDGATFTDLQTRDMTYTVRATGPGGLARLDADRALSGPASATDGNVVQTAGVAPDEEGRFTLALGYSTTAATAVDVAGAAARTPFALTYGRYALGWAAYDATLRPPPVAVPG
jgi:hypothetical protein